MCQDNEKDMLSVGKKLTTKTIIDDSRIVLWDRLRWLDKDPECFLIQDTASIITSLLTILISKFPDQNSFLDYRHIFKFLPSSMPEESHKGLKQHVQVWTISFSLKLALPLIFSTLLKGL